MARYVSQDAGSIKSAPDDSGALRLFALGMTSGCAKITQTGHRLPEDRYIRFRSGTMTMLYKDRIGHLDADGNPVEREPLASWRYGQRGFVATREFKLLQRAEIFDMVVAPYLTFDETAAVADALPGEVHRNSDLRLVKMHVHVAVAGAARKALCRLVPDAISHDGDHRPAENLFVLLHQNMQERVVVRVIEAAHHYLATHIGPQPVLGARLFARKRAALHIVVRTLGRPRVTCRTYKSLWERMTVEGWPLDEARSLVRHVRACSTIVCRCAVPPPTLPSMQQMLSLEYWREQQRLYSCSMLARVEDVLDDRLKMVVLLELLRRGRARPSAGDASNGPEDDRTFYDSYVETFGAASAAMTVCVAPVVDEADRYHLELAESDFAPHGPVTNILVPPGLGVGLVEFETREAAQRAVARRDGLGGATYFILADKERFDRQRTGAVFQLATRGFATSHVLRGNLKTIFAFSGL